MEENMQCSVQYHNHSLGSNSDKVLLVSGIIQTDPFLMGISSCKERSELQEMEPHCQRYMREMAWYLEIQECAGECQEMYQDKPL